MKGCVFLIAAVLAIGLFGIVLTSSCSGGGGGDDDGDDTTDDDAIDDDTTDDDTTDDDIEAPTYPNNHNVEWDCYICHEYSLMDVTTPEPHGHQYQSPTECVSCHKLGDWTNPYYAGGHNWSANCLTCHSGKHSRTWQDKSQCLVCHGEGTK